MKTIKLIIVIIIISFFDSYSQEWESPQSNGTYGFKMQFLNSNTGYIATKISYNTNKLFKTTDKGRTWNIAFTRTIPNGDGFAFDFVDENTGFIFVDNSIFRTFNGGSTWQEQSLNVFNSHPAQPFTIKFANSSTGYITYINGEIENYNLRETKILETTNGGYSWEWKWEKKGYSGSPYNYVISDISFEHNNNGIIDPNKVILIGYKYNINNFFETNSVYWYSDNGCNSVDESYGQGGIYHTSYKYLSIVPGTLNENKILRAYFNSANQNDPENGFYCNFSNSGTDNYKIFSYSNNIGMQDICGGISFINSNIGYTYFLNKIFKTSNGGYNWSELTGYQIQFPYYAGGNNINAIGDIIYLLDGKGNFIARKIPVNLFVFNDNTASTGTMLFDGIDNLNIDAGGSTYYLRGGYSSFDAPRYLNNYSEVFYKWNDNNSVNNTRSIYFDNPGNTYSSNYKSKLKTNTNTALKDAQQSKAIRDNFGRVNAIYESFGGIFFTKSYDNGQNFVGEEVISDNVNNADNEFTTNNTNPFLSEIMPPNSQYSMSSERNLVCVWEKRSGNNILINFAQRYSDQNGAPYFWSKRGSQYSISLSATDQNFKSYPIAYVKKGCPFQKCKQS